MAVFRHSRLSLVTYLTASRFHNCPHGGTFHQSVTEIGIKPNELQTKRIRTHTK
ncbi:MAG: hypothetical protein QOE54_100 [Streptosporangiaceae bacterium]|jgi:hypothetical protein|nr:hypothetical protein [Streptosporangiaceae bacterium]